MLRTQHPNHHTVRSTHLPKFSSSLSRLEPGDAEEPLVCFLVLLQTLAACMLGVVLTGQVVKIRPSTPTSKCIRGDVPVAFFLVNFRNDRHVLLMSRPNLDNTCTYFSCLSIPAAMFRPALPDDHQVISWCLELLGNKVSNPRREKLSFCVHLKSIPVPARPGDSNCLT